MLPQGSNGGIEVLSPTGNLCGCIAATQGRCIPFGAAAPLANNELFGNPLNLMSSLLHLEKSRHASLFRGSRPKERGCINTVGF